MHSMATSISKHNLCALADASPGSPKVGGWLPLLTHSSPLLREEKVGREIHFSQTFSEKYPLAKHGTSGRVGGVYIYRENWLMWGPWQRGKARAAQSPPPWVLSWLWMANGKWNQSWRLLRNGCWAMSLGMLYTVQELHFVELCLHI